MYIMCRSGVIIKPAGSDLIITKLESFSNKGI